MKTSPIFHLQTQNKLPLRIASRMAASLLALWLIQSAGAAANSQLTTFEYKRVGDEVLLLDVCVPPPAADAATTHLRPVVITVHGGGWGSVDRKTDFPPVLEALTLGGYIYVSMDYRLNPKYHWPAFCEDVDDAVAWMKAHVAEYGGDPDRMAILGYSAGGQLAFRTAVLDQPPHQLRALIGLAPATDFLEDLGRRGGPNQWMRQVMGCPDDEPLEKILLKMYERSPINLLHEGMPPILILQGTEDRTVPLQKSLNIQRKIEENHWRVPCEIYRIEGAPHRQTEWDKFDLGYKKKLLDWLGEHL